MNEEIERGLNSALNLAQEAVGLDNFGDYLRSVVTYKETIRILDTLFDQIPEENQTMLSDLVKDN